MMLGRDLVPFAIVFPRLRVVVGRGKQVAHAGQA
jgi:hypothetical protein